jgi:hypothetical protein
MNVIELRPAAATATDPIAKLILDHVRQAHISYVLASLDRDVQRERTLRALRVARQARFDASPVWARDGRFGL